MEKPTVSIIIPVYKVEKYLDNCIKSVINQTYTNLDIILVDDGSPDKCPQKCDEWAKSDNRIRVIHKNNGGLSDARNYGLREAKGEYIAFVDSDDWIASDMIEKMYEAIVEYDADMSVCQYILAYNDGSMENSVDIDYPTEVFSAQQAVALLLEDERITNHVWRKLYKKSKVPQDIFPVGKNFEDLYVMPRLFLLCEKIVCINDFLYFYRQNPNGIVYSNTIQTNIGYFYGICNMYNEIVENFPDLKKEAEYVKYTKLAYIWWNLAINRDQCKTENWKICRKLAREGLKQISRECGVGKSEKLKFFLLRKIPWIIDIYFNIKIKLRINMPELPPA